MTKNISVFGLGKLGASMVACLASRGFNIVGVDVLSKSVALLNRGDAPVKETGLDELIKDNKNLIRATEDVQDAINSSEASFVIVPTPSDSRGAFEIQYVAHAFKNIGRALRNKQGYHLVVLTSTVLPGSMRHGLIPVLEKESGKKCGKDFGVCYSPALIAIGTIIKDFLNPDFNFIGEFDEKSGSILEDIYTRMTLKEPAMRRMSIENVEIAKIALNSYITMKISFANVISELCEKVPSGDVDMVTQAIGSDSRIGSKYLKGGLGFGGTCFPRDNVALSFICRELNSSHSLLDTTDQYNDTLSHRFVKKILPHVRKGETAAVLGLAYKPLSHIVEESQSILLAKALSDAGLRVIGYDPLAADEARPVLQYHTLVEDNLENALKDATIVFIANNDEIFKKLTPEELLLDKEEVKVVDFWRCLNPDFETHPKIKYIPIGKCNNFQASNKKLEDLWR
jgi:UDPglucose 6-dehydrogenase